MIPDKLKKVPPFQPVAARLLTLLSHEDVTVAEIADLISSDAAFTARLLQRANSVLYGSRNSVTDTRDAITRIGLDETRRIVVLLGAAGYVHRAPSCVEMQDCWRHSLATAVLAHEIAKTSPVFSKTAFTAGILHDIGRIGLLAVYSNEYIRGIRDANGHHLDLLDFERECFGVDHAEAGRILAEEWKLPSEFRIVAGRHHDRCEGVELDLVWIVHVACRLADLLGFSVLSQPCGDDTKALLDTLPAGAGQHLQGREEELRVQIEDYTKAMT